MWKKLGQKKFEIHLYDSIDAEFLFYFKTFNQIETEWHKKWQKSAGGVYAIATHAIMFLIVLFERGKQLHYWLPHSLNLSDYRNFVGQWNSFWEIPWLFVRLLLHEK